MGTPLDIAAGAAGFASLGIILLQGCVKGFILLATAQNFGKDADVARCEIEFQQYRLFRWAEKAGLNGGSPNRTLNWAVVNEQLKQLDSLVGSTSKFKKEYGLEIETTEEIVSSEDLEAPKSGLRRLMAQVKPEFHNESARVLHKGTTVWKRLKWATIDKTGLSMLMSDIQRSVDNLHFLLQETDNKFIRDGMEALLRHVISQATESTQLSKIEHLLERKGGQMTKIEEDAVATALKMKQKRFQLGFGEDIKAATTSVSPTTVNSLVVLGKRIPTQVRGPKSRKPLSFGLLVRDSRAHDILREMATYDGKTVLVEWKIVDQGIESKLKHRIKTLAALLEGFDGKTFHSLNCLGFLKDPGTGNYGYVFQAPYEKCEEFTTLSEILKRGNTLPPLGDRIALATALVETVLQLHTSGWLHKGVRSDNILFFHQPSTRTRVTRPYLEGYEYARADNPSDMTESPVLQQESNLFRHPALLKANRASFCKQFDLYAFGCVLIEIGLWQDLTSILLHRIRMKVQTQKPVIWRFPMAAVTYSGKAEAAELNKARAELLSENEPGSIMEALEFSVGQKFADLVRLCLAPNQSSKSAESDEDEETEDDEDHCIDLELKILEKLGEFKL